MPGRDCTGPDGQGPMTGRGYGRGYRGRRSIWGRGFFGRLIDRMRGPYDRTVGSYGYYGGRQGYGMRRGRGFGRGMGGRRRYAEYGGPAQPPAMRDSAPPPR